MRACSQCQRNVLPSGTVAAVCMGLCTQMRMVFMPTKCPGNNCINGIKVKNDVVGPRSCRGRPFRAGTLLIFLTLICDYGHIISKCMGLSLGIHASITSTILIDAVAILHSKTVVMGVFKNYYSYRSTQ